MANPNVSCPHSEKRRCDSCRLEARRTSRRKWAKANPAIDKAVKKRWVDENAERVKINQRLYYANNKEQHNNTCRQWRLSHLPLWREIVRRKRGVCWAAGQSFEQLVEQQAGRCAICKRDLGTFMSRDVHVDHDHDLVDRPNVRGILCKECNTRLGVFEKTRHLHTAFVEYAKLSEFDYVWDAA